MPEIMTTNLGSRYFSAGKQEMESIAYGEITALSILCWSSSHACAPYETLYIYIYLNNRRDKRV